MLLLVFIVVIAYYVVKFICDGVQETKIMKHMDKTCDQNYEKLKEYYRKQGIKIGK